MTTMRMSSNGYMDLPSPWTNCLNEAGLQSQPIMILENRERMCNSHCHELSVINRGDGTFIAKRGSKRHKIFNSLEEREGKGIIGDRKKAKESRPGEHKRRSSSGEGYRKWVYSDNHSCLPLQGKFVILSYNILGVDSVSKHSDLYCRIPPHIMDWNRRKRLICKELSIWKPDVACLQEVDRFDDLMDSFGREGYIGVFKGRTGEVRDGCAIFWRKHVFSLLQEESIEFKELDLRDNVAQLCVFKVNQKVAPVQGDDGTNPMEVDSLQEDEWSKRRGVIVGNIHVLFNPKRGDIKLGQVRVLLQKAHELSEKWGNLPVVLAGDFNCTPQSALYKFLASSELDILAHDRSQISGQLGWAPGLNIDMSKPCTMTWVRPGRCRWSEDELKTATGSSGCTRLEHPLKLCSAYACVKGIARTRDSSGEPLATSYHSKFMGTVDYIWHSEGLTAVRVLDTLPLDVLRKTSGLPSKKWGSDHLALACELTFASNQRGDNSVKSPEQSDIAVAGELC